VRRIARAARAFWKELRGRKTKQGQLREFVYLDETSVESLLASLDGEVLTGITESRTKGYELGLSATGAAPGVPVGFSPSAKRSRSITVEEQRKSVAQSAFARLRSRHYQSLRLEAEVGREEKPRRYLDSRTDLDLSTLRRGDLIEVDAVLGAAEVFKVKTVIDSMIGVVNAFPEMVPGAALAAIRQGAPIGALLGSLSQGLIPIEGVVAGYKSVKFEEREWIVADAIAQALVELGGTAQDVIIAGVTLEPLYWQDTRRVLFSHYKYRVLGRLVHDGGRSAWSAVKLSDVLQDVNVGLRDTIDSLGPMFLKALQEGEDHVSAASSRKESSDADEVLLRFALTVAVHSNLAWNADVESEAKQIVASHSSAADDPESWRDA
jgi:hypothetical protein